MVLSDDPLTTSRSLYCKQAIPRLCPFRVRTNSQVLVLHTCGQTAALLEDTKSCHKIPQGKMGKEMHPIILVFRRLRQEDGKLKDSVTA